MGWSVERALRALRLDHADVLLLGLWNKPVPARIMDAARRLKERGLVRFVACSSHNRPLIARMVAGNDLDVIHFRYNAAHTGAESDIFPHIPSENPPGMVSYTTTSWGQLMNPKKTPKNERTPTAADCYRFVLARPEVECLHDRAVQCATDGPRARSVAPGPDVRSRTSLDAARGRRHSRGNRALLGLVAEP